MRSVRLKFKKKIPKEILLFELYFQYINKKYDVDQTLFT